METEILPAWTPPQIARHYHFPTEFSGRGQSIAVISLGGAVDLAELRNNFKAMKLPVPTIGLKNVGTIPGEQDQQPSGETHIDVEVLGTLCPEAKITIYRGANPLGFADAVESALVDKNQVVSISWGIPENTESPNSKMEQVLKKAKKTKTTVCAATGDGGASGNNNSKGMAVPAPDGKAHVPYPASSPQVLACGGTQLEQTSSAKTEVVWNETAAGGAASGGGVSEVFEKPSWQSDFKIPSVNTGHPGRIVPDVAGLAARGDWKIYLAGKGRMAGGTSAVAPLWAALITLANEARAAEGKEPVGFVNAELYQLMTTHRELFKDITSGTNRLHGKRLGYDAQKGFDACSGWGVPNGAKLFQALKELP